MRTLNWKYIQNIATTIVGKNTISQLNLEYGRTSNCKPRPLYLYLNQKVREKVKEMNAETLGRIAAFAYPHGFHYEFERNGSPPDFISLTGYEDLMHESDLGFSYGQMIMEKLVIATIIAIVRDMVMQSKWRYDWACEVDMEHLID
jgi:hypothetical protein